MIKAVDITALISAAFIVSEKVHSQESLFLSIEHL